MSGQIDLIPASCRAALGRRARVRGWICAYSGAVLVLGAAFMVVRAGEPRLAVEKSRLEAEVQQKWLQNAEVQRLVGSINELSGHIARYDRLAWPVRISDVIAALGEQIPDSLTLTSLTLTPRHEGGRVVRSKPKPGAKATEEPAARSVLAVEIEGIAPDDFALALFVSGIEAHPLFKSVALDYARSRVVDGRESRGFRVTSEIDLSVQYAFIEPVSAGGAE